MCNFYSSSGLVLHQSKWKYVLHKCLDFSVFIKECIRWVNYHIEMCLLILYTISYQIVVYNIFYWYYSYCNEYLQQVWTIFQRIMLMMFLFYWFNDLLISENKCCTKQNSKKWYQGVNIKVILWDNSTSLNN